MKIDADLRFLGNNAFDSGFNLTHIDLSKVEQIQKGALNDCSRLLELNNDKITILNESCCECSNLRSLNLENLNEIANIEDYVNI